MGWNKKTDIRKPGRWHDQVNRLPGRSDYGGGYANLNRYVFSWLHKLEMVLSEASVLINLVTQRNLYTKPALSLTLLPQSGGHVFLVCSFVSQFVCVQGNPKSDKKIFG